MLKISKERKLRIVKVLLYISGIILLFWWPLSHWFYSDLYHQMLGFQPGSYQDSMVKIIGTCGAIPVLLLFFSARNPEKNKDSVITIIIFALMISLTYIHLITTGVFPVMEFINVGFSLLMAILLIVFYPWDRFKKCP